MYILNIGISDTHTNNIKEVLIKEYSKALIEYEKALIEYQGNLVTLIKIESKSLMPVHKKILKKTNYLRLYNYNYLEFIDKIEKV